MTNRENIVILLSNKDLIGEDNKKYEKMINENISCPYYNTMFFYNMNQSDLVNDEKTLCRGNVNEASKEICKKCKNEWLDSEV